MQVQLDDDAIRAATINALMAALTPEVKEKLVGQAITAMLQRTETSRFGGKTESPIEQAFRNAVEQVSREECRKMVQEDEGLRVQLRELMRQTADKILNCDLDKLADRMANSFVESMKRDSY